MFDFNTLWNCNMQTTNTLSTEERNYFKLVQDAISANPFSKKRDELNIQIAGYYNLESSQDPLIQTILDVKKRINKLFKNNKTKLNKYSKKDKTLLVNAILFDLFHTHIDDFDQLIIQQLNNRNDEIKVDFADNAIDLLISYGFTLGESLRFFSLCFQLRRAFYFIDRNLIGKSSVMQKLRESLWNNVFTSDIRLYEEFLWNRMEDFSTMILGETGTGKGRAAMAIGRSGYIPFDYDKKCFTENFTQSFISINLSQFPETLIESELFGHSKGAFTGAVKNYDGIFSRCRPCGAIFLDEIGDVSHSLQIKLLKVLEEREFTPVGSREVKRFKGRVIAATNKPINNILKDNLMREDFFYRLCSDLIHMPPLRDRIKEEHSELKDLTSYTITTIVGKNSPELTSMIISAIRKNPGANYEWPGNVRELGQCIRRILLNKEYKQHNAITQPPTELSEEFIEKISAGKLSAAQLIKIYCNHIYESSGTYGDVARKTGLDRRTVKKYLDEWLKESKP